MIQNTVFMRNYSKFSIFFLNALRNNLGDFNAKLGKGSILKLTVGNGSRDQDRNDNSVRIVNFAT
jgi:hypothetical protein